MEKVDDFTVYYGNCDDRTQMTNLSELFVVIRNNGQMSLDSPQFINSSVTFKLYDARCFICGKVYVSSKSSGSNLSELDDHILRVGTCPSCCGCPVCQCVLQGRIGDKQEAWMQCTFCHWRSASFGDLTLLTQFLAESKLSHPWLGAQLSAFRKKLRAKETLSTAELMAAMPNVDPTASRAAKYEHFERQFTAATKKLLSRDRHENISEMGESLEECAARMQRLTIPTPSSNSTAEVLCKELLATPSQNWMDPMMGIDAQRSAVPLPSSIMAPTSDRPLFLRPVVLSTRFVVVTVEGSGPSSVVLSSPTPDEVLGSNSVSSLLSGARSPHLVNFNAARLLPSLRVEGAKALQFQGGSPTLENNTPSLGKHFRHVRIFLALHNLCEYATKVRFIKVVGLTNGLVHAKLSNGDSQLSFHSAPLVIEPQVLHRSSPDAYSEVTCRNILSVNSQVESTLQQLGSLLSDHRLHFFTDVTIHHPQRVDGESPKDGAATTKQRHGVALEIGALLQESTSSSSSGNLSFVAYLSFQS